MNFRPLNRGDLRWLGTFACSDGSAYAKYVEEKARDLWRWRCESEAHEVFVLEVDDGVPAGVCAFEPYDDEEWFFCLVAVSLPYQRANVGRILFNMCLDMLAVRTPNAYARWKVEIDNLPSHKLSQRVGGEADPIVKSGSLVTYHLQL